MSGGLCVWWPLCLVDSVFGGLCVWWPLCLVTSMFGGPCFSRPLCLADSVFGGLFSSPVLLSARVASVFGSLCSSRCRVLARGFSGSSGGPAGPCIFLVIVSAAGAVVYLLLRCCGRWSLFFYFPRVGPAYDVTH